jgi:hypothetical protein
MIGLQSSSNRDLDFFLRATVALQGDRLLLFVGSQPRVVIAGIEKLMNRLPIDATRLNQLVLPILSNAQKDELNNIGVASICRTAECRGKNVEFPINICRSGKEFSLEAKRLPEPKN